MSSESQNSQLADRRGCPREFTDRELVITWHHDPRQNLRYGLFNESQGGCLIVSTVPLIEGMTGTILARIPAKGHRSSSVIVAWSRRVNGKWHVGLRFLT